VKPLPVHAPRDGFGENPLGEYNPYAARPRGLSHRLLADRLQWLSWYQPGVFTAVMDYMEFCDTLAAETDPCR